MIHANREVCAVVIGAGPTGATAAIMLAQSGIECLVLERAAGRLCPQPRIGTAHGEVRLDAALGDGFAITRDQKGFTKRDAEAREFFDALGVRVIQLGEPAKGCVVDLDGTLTAMLNKAGANALLLRPYRVVAASAGRVDLAGWRRLLESGGVTVTAARTTSDR